MANSPSFARRRLGRALTGAVVGAFATGVSCGPAPHGTPSDLRTCAVGWWLGAVDSCQSVCSGQPECSYTDCELRSFIGLRADAKSATGFISVSASHRQFSAYGSVSLSSWYVSDGGLAVGSASSPGPASCTKSELDLGLTRYDKSPVELALGLDSAFDAGAWTSRSY
jgi:hypothetical protein